MTHLPDRPQARLLRADDAGAWASGFDFLTAARHEADRIRATATAEMAAARAEGRADGLAEGERAAARLMLDTRAAMDRHLAGAERQIVDLVMAVLHDVLGQVDDGALVARTARHALTALRGTHDLTLSVPVPLVPEVEAHLHSMGCTRIRVAPDRLLSGRQCVLTDTDSSIDLGVDAQLAAIRATMEGAA